MEQAVSDSEHFNVKIVPETPIDTKKAFNIQSTVTHSPLHLQPPPPATPPLAVSPPAAPLPVAPPSVALGTCATNMAGGTVETEAMDEGRPHSSWQKDTASEKTVDKGGNEPLRHSDQAEVEKTSLQPSPSSPSVAGGPSHAATGKECDPGQVEGDRPVPAPSLLKGMVFYITDYNQSMEATIIQKWKQVRMYVYVCIVCLCTRVCTAQISWLHMKQTTTHHVLCCGKTVYSGPINVCMFIRIAYNVNCVRYPLV